MWLLLQILLNITNEFLLNIFKNIKKRTFFNTLLVMLEKWTIFIL